VVLHSGEAHFKVARNEARPFIVAVGEVAVRALGTAFSIDRRGEGVDVVVTEGTVAVESAIEYPAAPLPLEDLEKTAATPDIVPTTAPWVLEAGNRIVVPTGPNAGVPEVLRLPGAELRNRLAWRSPRVEFARAPMTEVIRVVNRYSPVRFSIGDPKLETVTLSGLFRADDSDAFTRALERHFDIDATRVSEIEIVLRSRQ
jgi:transmembrane sensor